ncbi:MAG: hypothetical protein ACRC0L_08010 [Angustibacter sp.]
MPETPWTSKPLLITGALATGIIIALTAALIITNRDQQPAPPPQAAPSASPSPTGTPPGDASVCGLTDTNSTIPTTGPTARWSLLGTIAVPTIDGQGPGKIEPDGFRYCYAHTPTGALLAAANLMALDGSNTLEGKMESRLIAPGKGRDFTLRQKNTPIPDMGIRVAISGFKITNYTSNQAEVTLAVSSNVGAYATSSTTLIWSKGDWLMYAPEINDDYIRTGELESLSGFTPWSGV